MGQVLWQTFLDWMCEAPKFLICYLKSLNHPVLNEHRCIFHLHNSDCEDDVTLLDGTVGSPWTKTPKGISL
jgi:hypothetical protein